MNGILKDPKPMRVLTGEGSFEYTPKTELGRLLIETNNEAMRDGQRPYSTDEILKAMELERAGYDGMGKLWRNEPISTQI
jgi:hypothetical protein